MIHKRKIISYLLDLMHGAKKYPSGWLKPKVVIGYFNKDEIGKHQRLFFKELLKLGLIRTYWQLVFPKQTAGLIKKIPPTTNGTDEYHIRFYRDGVIDCELEINRFNRWHWAGPRIHGIDILKNILDYEINGLSEIDKEKIRGMFGKKDYSKGCVRKKHNPLS